MFRGYRDPSPVEDARTRKGTLCQGPAVRGKKRCRMHGGAKGSGAPKGNKNRLLHGRFAREAIEERRKFRRLIYEVRALIGYSQPY